MKMRLAPSAGRWYHLSMYKYFDINKDGYSIRCKLYYRDKGIRRAVLFGHGFGGHKDNRAAERFAEYFLAKYRNTAVICFDWPCHGSDGRKKLRLEDCSAYLRLTVEYIRTVLGAEMVSVYATSFGGYLVLKYICENGNPFSRIALRCPAVNMYRAMTRNIISEEAMRDISKGKDTLVGFDRKVKIGPDFLEELRQADITQRDFIPYADDILILHGTLDEIIPFREVADFADRNVIELIPVDRADHRFTDLKKMEEAICRISAFLAGQGS